MAQGEDSGIAEGLTIARPIGPFNPEISAGFTVAPAVVYSAIGPATGFTTNRSEPESAMQTRSRLRPNKSGAEVSQRPPPSA